MARNLKLLLVDDSPSSLQLLRGILEGKGFSNLQEATDGEGALRAIREGMIAKAPFDLVLCDWNMPNKSGLELIRELRADLDFRVLPVIMITTANQFDQIKTAIASGATNYLIKPYTAETLMEKLEFVIEKYRLGKG